MDGIFRGKQYIFFQQVPRTDVWPSTDLFTKNKQEPRKFNSGGERNFRRCIKPVSNFELYLL